jgi:hypothetical protein
MRGIASYTLEVLAPSEVPAEEGSAYNAEQQERRVLSKLPALVEEAEENLSDMLPEGFRVRISEAQF